MNQPSSIPRKIPPVIEESGLIALIRAKVCSATATSIILGPVKDTGVSSRTLAETGLTASTAFSVSPQKVAAATLRAIGNPKAEIVVSIGPGRLLKALMDCFPGLGPALNRLSGADKLMTSVADYREATRTYPARHNNSQAA